MTPPRPLYEDDQVTCDAAGLVLKSYYAGVLPKRVPWARVRWFRVHRLTFLGGKWRIGGMGLAPVWFSTDTSRPKKDFWIEVASGGPLRAGFSPDDPAAVVALLRERGVPQRGELA